MTNSETEVWKPYPDYPFIQASNFGRVRTVDRYIRCKNGSKRFVKGRVLKQRLNPNGYMYVGFGVNGKSVWLSVHRVIATTFVPNPNNLPEVNHIDCDRTNNSVSNLEWCTHEYNDWYREKYGIALKRPVFAVNLETLEILHFESQSEASRQLGVCVWDICAVVKGRQKTVNGYWLTENENEITKEKIREIKNNTHLFGNVIAINLKSFEVVCFESQSEAARRLRISVGNVGGVIKGRRKKTHDFWFCYADEYAIEKVRSKFGDEITNRVEDLLNEI